MSIVGTMTGIEDLYNLMKPIACLIEQKKEAIDSVVHTIEFGGDVTEEQWDIVSNISSNVLEMSFSGGDTTMNYLKNMAEDNDN